MPLFGGSSTNISSESTDAEPVPLESEAAVTKSFQDLDSDGDGKITKKEFLAAGGTEAEFAAMDADGDGVVDSSELAKARGQYGFVEGIIFDPAMADEFVPDILNDSRMCYGAYSLKQFEGILRFVLPLLNVWATAMSMPYFTNATNPDGNPYESSKVDGACQLLWYLPVWLLFAGAHMVMGAYPLLCCGRPAFDLLQIFITCCGQCYTNLKTCCGLCEDGCCTKCQGGGMKCCACPCSCEKSCPKCRDWWMTCFSPCAQCLSDLWRFASSIPLWSIIFFAVVGVPLESFFIYAVMVGNGCASVYWYRAIAIFCTLANGALTGVRLAYGSLGSKNGQANFYTSLV